jgi:hypothetical protein
MKGGDDVETASPFTVAYWAEVTEVTVDAGYRALPVLSFTVPTGWGADAFAKLAQEVAGALRVRWGNVGYTYADWDIYGGNVAERAKVAHAKRFFGYDTGESVRCMDAFYARLRSVSWLTLVGSTLASELPPGRTDELTRSPLLRVSQAASGLVVQAGPAPNRCDINRLALAPEYVEADRLLRDIRAQTAAGLLWIGWADEAEIERWLRRFEVRVR